MDTALGDLAAGIRAVDPSDPRQAIVYDHLLTELNALRGQREALAIDSGGMVIVGYTYLYGVERLRAQVAMTGALTIIIALALFVILALDYPFTGDLHVRPDALVHALTALGPPS